LKPEIATEFPGTLPTLKVFPGILRNDGSKGRNDGTKGRNDGTEVRNDVPVDRVIARRTTSRLCEAPNVTSLRGARLTLPFSMMFLRRGNLKIEGRDCHRIPQSFTQFDVFPGILPKDESEDRNERTEVCNDGKSVSLLVTRYP